MTDMFHMVGVVPFDRKRRKEAEAEKLRARMLSGNTAPLHRRNTHELKGRSLAELPADDLDFILVAEDEQRRRGMPHHLRQSSFPPPSPLLPSPLPLPPV